MAKNNSSNQDYTNNADGFDLTGGTTRRKLTVSGGDVGVVGGGGQTFNMPSAGGTLALQADIPKRLPFFQFSTDYPATGKFVNTTVSTGTATYTGAGLTLSTGATATASQRNLWTFQNDNVTIPVFSLNPIIGISLYLNSAATITGQWYGGLGNITVAGAGHTFTGSHIGFKIVGTGTTTSLYGTVANGTTETATAALTTLVANDTLMLLAVTTGSTNVAFYVSKNFGAWSSVTNVTTNIPTGSASGYVQQSVSNVSTANTFSIITQQATIAY